MITASAELVDAKRRRLNLGLLLAAFATPQSRAGVGVSDAPHVVTDFDWFDAARSRAVPARLYWPAAAAFDVPVPLVLFSHGMGGSRQGYRYLGRHWSARGIASLHVQHVGSDSRLWRGNPFGLVGRLQAAARETEAIARAADMRFALDRLLSDPATSKGMAIDHGHIVAAGHSYGANTALLTAGAHVVRNRRVVDCFDARVRAAVLISAPAFFGERDLGAVLDDIRVPTLHVTSTGDVIGIPGFHSGLDDRLAIFDAVANRDKLLAVFAGGSHSMFTDRSITGGTALNPRVKAATADLTTAWFASLFKADVTALAQWQRRWHAILARPLTS